MTKEFDAKLKPCPFCGGMRPHACICAQRWAVRCPECGATVVSDSADDGGESAAERWNARAAEEDRRTVRTCRAMRTPAPFDPCELSGVVDIYQFNCSECYGLLDPGWSFCPHCGRKVER